MDIVNRYDDEQTFRGVAALKYSDPSRSRETTPDSTDELKVASAVVFRGVFTASELATGLSTAPHFQARSVPVTVWFADFRILPVTAYRHSRAVPVHMTVRFDLPDDFATVLVVHSFAALPAATSEDFRALSRALASSTPGTASPTPAERYLQRHPRADAFLNTALPVPVSYATTRYFGVQSFRFTSASGRRVVGRYRLEPSAGEQSLAESARERAQPGYLRREIWERSRREAVLFQLQLQLPEQGDALDDPSDAWPDTCLTVPLGTLALTHIVAEVAGAAHAPLFAPTPLPDGIESVVR